MEREDEKQLILAIEYNLSNFGCIDPLECKSVDEFLNVYFNNLQDDLERRLLDAETN